VSPLRRCPYPCPCPCPCPRPFHCLLRQLLTTHNRAIFTCPCCLVNHQSLYNWSAKRISSSSIVTPFDLTTNWPTPWVCCKKGSWAELSWVEVGWALHWNWSWHSYSNGLGLNVALKINEYSKWHFYSIFILGLTLSYTFEFKVRNKLLAN